MTVDQAISYCTKLTKEHSSTFSLGSSSFQPDMAIHILYAACRQGDGAMDEALSRDDAYRRLERWWQGVERAYTGTPYSGEPLELGLRWVLEQYAVPKGAFEELRLGFETDLRWQWHAAQRAETAPPIR
jgi:phytoene synthase